MKYSIIVILLFCSASIFSQVGIGTTTPHSTSILDLTATNKALLLTRVANTSAVASPTNGMLIYDISSKCVKGFENGEWTGCLSGRNDQIADVVVDCDANGFQGNYFNNIAINATNKYSVTITNNTFSNVTFTFATSDLVLSGVDGVAVASVSPATSQTLTPGQSRLIEYTLSGNPTSNGTLTGTWTKQSLKCVKSVAVNLTPVFSINCSGATTDGTLYSGEGPISTTSVIPYVGNEASAHTGQIVTSTGVTGLTATLAPGNFVIGDGTFTYNITGTPSGPGTANFAISMGMRSCTLAVTINPPTSFTNCSLSSAGTMTINTAYTAGSVTQTVRVNVTKLGTYNITTNTVGNLTFSASGTFTTLGFRDVVLVATGAAPNVSGNLTFTATLTGTSGSSTCTFVRYVRPTTVTGGLSSISSNGCNGGGQGGSDLRTFGWQDTGSSIFLSGGNYSLSFNANITARGRVYSGNPNKPLEGMVQYRLRNTSTGQIFLQTSGGRTTYSGCQNRGVGEHSAGGGYSQAVGSQSLPAGNYVLQAFGESYMGGCSSGGSDSWAGCGLSVNSGNYTITAN